MNEEEYLLKWNNHQTNFVDVFNHLLKDDAFVDVTLVCSGEAVHGHRMVLAACSPLLHSILRDNPCKHPVLILSEVPADDMRSMMRFIYQGEVSVSKDELASFLKTADNLQIKGLAEVKENDRDHHLYHHHRSKDERKRKEKDERLEGRSGSKRQRISDARATDACSPLLSNAFKPVGDSHSSHRTRSRVRSDDHSPRNGGSGGLHIPSSKHLSKNSSSKIVVHGIPNRVINSCLSKESLISENSLLKTERTQDLTIKTEPLDYPGEMVWTEGHGAINSDILDDPQPLLPLGAIPGTLEGVAIALATSPNLPGLETKYDGQCDDESRGDMSTTSDDINANTTTGEVEEEVKDESLTTGGSPSKFRGGRKACCFCGKTFCDNYTMRRHMVTHLSRERQFECPMCTAAYSRKDHLMGHIRRKHSMSDDVDKREYNTEHAS